ncbi:MAG: response regulator [Gammaproteobacteria bacterium]|nr:response regulator [Gammaproteobacteria bacterium]
MPEVIIIDDEFQFAEMLAEVAHMCGFDTVIYTESRKFLEQNFEADIIFLDLTIPDIDGIEVISELGKRQSKASLILMSGFDEVLLQTAKRIAQGYNLEVIDALTKPLNISDVIQLLENLKNTL